MEGEQKAKEKAETEKEEPAQEVAKDNAVNEEEFPPKFFQKKMGKVEENPCLHEYHEDISLQDFVQKFDHLSAGEAVESEVHSITGKGREA